VTTKFAGKGGGPEISSGKVTARDFLALAPVEKCLFDVYLLRDGPT